MPPKSPEQFARIREERKEQILDAALHVFAKEGYHSSSMAQVAERAGISKGLIYNYFENKQTLLRAIMLDVIDVIIGGYVTEDGKPFTSENFIAAIEENFEMVKNDLQFWKLYFAILVQPNVQETIMGEMMQRAMPFMAMLTQYFAQKGDTEPEVTMRFFGAVIDGIMLHIMMDPAGFPAERIRQRLIEQFI